MASDDAEKTYEVAAVMHAINYTTCIMLFRWYPVIPATIQLCSYTRVETGSGHPGQPGHILSGSSGSDPLYKISGSDPDSTLYHMCDDGVWPF